MPEFSNPFGVKKSDRTLTKEELIRAIRFSIASEYEAVQIYTQLAESIDNKDAKKLLMEVAHDEVVHAGNFLALLAILDPEEERLYKQGAQEAIEVMEGKEDSEP